MLERTQSSSSLLNKGGCVFDLRNVISDSSIWAHQSVYYPFTSEIKDEIQLRELKINRYGHAYGKRAGQLGGQLNDSEVTELRVFVCLIKRDDFPGSLIFSTVSCLKTALTQQKHQVPPHSILSNSSCSRQHLSNNFQARSVLETSPFLTLYSPSCSCTERITSEDLESF